MVEELLDMADARIGDLASGDLFNSPFGHARCFGNLGPRAARGLKARENVVVHAGLFHIGESKPVFGFAQPAFGFRKWLTWNLMKGKKKTPKVRAAFIRHVLAQNVDNLLKSHFKESENFPKALSAAAKKAGFTMSISTAQRILKEESGATLDNLQAIADIFDISIYQLLLPNLQADNPQVVQGAVKEEERMFRRWRRGTSPAGSETDKILALARK